MTMRNGLLCLLATVLGAATVVLPAVAGSETVPAIEARSSKIYGEVHYWSPSAAQVSAGGAVTFTNPSAEARHGLKFTEGPATPNCTGVPTEATGAFNWRGECTFSTPGTYSFICTVHPIEMKGTITVTAGATTTTTTTTTTTGTTTTTTTGSVPSAGSKPGESGARSSAGASGSPLAGSASSAIRLRAIQRGKSVRGSVEISPSGAAGRLVVRLLAARASLASAIHAQQLQVGRLVRSSLPTGAVSFAVTLDAKARHALRVHRRLALTVQILVSAPSGSTVAVTRGVVLHP